MSKDNSLTIENIFAYENEYIDCKVLESKGIDSINSKLYFMGVELTGGDETKEPYQECFFGELDSKDTIGLGLDTLKPIYYLTGKMTYDIKESKDIFSQTLKVFYKNHTLTILNYSIIDSSLNIKLECNSKESQKLLSNALSLKEKEYQSKTIQAQQSIATLHSLLENQEVKCIHGGKVILKSNKGKTFKSDGIPLILESDLLGSKISGCPRSVGGVSDPCTQVVNVKASLSQKKINGEYAILQELIGGCLTDKGFPLEVSFVPSKIKFDHSYDPKIGLTKQSLTTSQSFNLPILRLYYKEHNYQIDNTLIQRYTLNNTLYELKEESNPQFFKEVIFEEKDLMDLSKNIENTKDIAPYQDKIILFDSLKQEFQKYYEFKEVTLNLGIHTFFLIFVIPKRIPKIYQKDYKALDSQRKDYGIGYFKELLEYNKDYKETNTQNNPYTPFLLYHTRVFLAPAKAKKIHFEFALGLDNYIESKDKESNTNVCKFKVLSGDVIEEREEVEGGEKTDTIQIFNKEGIYLFSIEKKDRTETRLSVSELYKLQGIQWFESGAENYHKLLDVNPDLKDKEKCEGLGVLYFTWRDIVEFAEALYQPVKNRFDLMDFVKYFSGNSGDWKQSPKGARGYVLVSMEGIPYWADAVGQIPYAINAYKAFYSFANNHTSAKNAVVNIGYIFSKGEKNELLDLRKYIQWNTNIDLKLYEENPNPPSDKDSYDNKMIVRAIRYVYLSKYANNQSLALDSQGNNIYEK
ncbi:hypothetical protein P5N26_001707 [Campylobacter coli]|nr:hypothetical protein [Campylobacter coli]EKQ4933952.1 hypothetical protein [Campylobacter coli]